jgi:hypothetical protein
MPRRFRIELEGAIDHVMARGNGRQNIVRDDEDRRGLLHFLDRAVVPPGWEMVAFVILSIPISHQECRCSPRDMLCTRTGSSTCFIESFGFTCADATKGFARLGPESAFPAGSGPRVQVLPIPPSLARTVRYLCRVCVGAGNDSGGIKSSMHAASTRGHCSLFTESNG